MLHQNSIWLCGAKDIIFFHQMVTNSGWYTELGNRTLEVVQPNSLHGDRHVQVVQPVFRSLGEMKIHGLSRQIFEQKAHFEASNFHSFLVPSRQISLAFVNGFRQSKSFIFSLIFKECIFGMQIDFYSGFEIQLFLNRFPPSISLSSILAS